MDKSIKAILDNLPRYLSDYVIDRQNRGKAVTEIRIRSGFPPIVRCDGKDEMLQDPAVSRRMLEQIFSGFCCHTLSAYEDQIIRGYITLAGGHRVGIGGIYYTDDAGRKFLSSVSSLNIRISNDISYKIPVGIMDFSKGLLVAGRPHSGKTTFLKTVCDMLKGKNVAVCDERQEIYSPDKNCDFVSGIAKRQAILHATRSLGPDIIICDEVGGDEETKQILSAVNSGVKFICSCHRRSVEEVKMKPNISVLLDAKVFDKIIVLDREQNNYFIKEEVYV